MELLPLAEHHGTPCPYCGLTMLIGTYRQPTKDHVRPKRAGGYLNNGNKLIVCKPCNGDKKDMMLSEFLAWLESKNDPRADFVRRINPNLGLADV